MAQRVAFLLRAEGAKLGSGPEKSLILKGQMANGWRPFATKKCHHVTGNDPRRLSEILEARNYPKGISAIETALFQVWQHKKKD